MPKINWKTVLIVAGIVLVTLKFRAQILGMVTKVPFVGNFVA